MMQSFIGLAGLIFEINGRKLAIYKLFCNQNLTLMRSCCVLDAHARCTHDMFCDHACASLKTQRDMNLCPRAYGLSL